MKRWLLFLYMLAGCSLISGFWAKRCGDGDIDTDEGETCDDGNTEASDGCDDLCQDEAPPNCGDGLLNNDEECDDANNVNGDGCDASCQLEVGANCGDGILNNGEVCDDGNIINGDDCDNNCTFTECGNNIVTNGEECDDGNNNSGDGCDAVCSLEVGCGNGSLDAGEECDDGNRIVGDGCGLRCRDEIGAKRLETGSNHTCALMQDNSMFCWGAASRGQLGYGDPNIIGDNEVPADAGPVFTGVSDLSLGGDHTCAVLVNNEARCWGSNASGQLGQGDIEDFGAQLGETPSALPDIINLGITLKLKAGGDVSCAIDATQKARCWGDNSNRQLGDGTNINLVQPDITPIDFISAETVTDLAVGGLHVCALVGTQLFCWGNNASGQLGYGDVLLRNVPPSQAVPLPSGILQVSAGGSHTCVVQAGGSVVCWGDGVFGKLGYGSNETLGDDEIAGANGGVSLALLAQQISAGGEHTCALLGDGSIQCWGRNNVGQLGSGDFNNIGDDELPGSLGVLSFDNDPATQVSAGSEHTCALFQSGNIRCWGSGSTGQLGYGDTNTVSDASEIGFVPLF